MIKAIYPLFILLLWGCSRADERPVYSKYKPVLMSTDKVSTDLMLKPAQAALQIRQMRQMDQYLFALDYGLGLHIFDYSNPSAPVNRGFYQIPACVDFEVQGRLVYANNYRDLIIINWTDINQPLIQKRSVNIFDIQLRTPDGNLVFPDMEKLPPNTTIISYEKI